MSVRDIHSSSEFRKVLEEAGPKMVVVQFHATWCGPCRRISPEYVSISKEYPKGIFLRVDVDECKALAMDSGTSSVPMFHFYRSGTKQAEVRGADPEALRQTVQDQAKAAGANDWGQARRLGGGSSPSPVAGGSPSHADDAARQQEMREARLRAAEAAARRMEAATGHCAAVDADKVGTASTIVPACDAMEEGDDDSDIVGTVGRCSGAVCAAGGSASKAPSIRANEGFVTQLCDMGYTRGAAIRGLQEVNNAGVVPALDWIMGHPGEEGEQPGDSPAPSSGTDEDPSVMALAGGSGAQDGDADGATGDSSADAQGNCGEGNAMVVEETEEEKRIRAQKKAEELQKIIAEKRKKKEEEDAARELEREKKRRLEGKEYGKLKDQIEDEAEKREAMEAKKRRAEEKAHRRAVQRKIQEAKEERRRKALEAKGGSVSEGSPSTPQAASTAPPKKEYTECTIQVRFPSGTTSVEIFSVNATVGDVFERFGLSRSEHKLVCTFPRRVYQSSSDMRVTMKDADMVPRGQFTIQNA